MRFFFASFNFYYCFFVPAFFSFFCIFLFHSICIRLVCRRMHFLLCVISRRRQTPSCIISNFHSIRVLRSTTVFFSCFASHLIVIILSIVAMIDSFVFRVHYVGRNSIEFQKRVKRTKTKTGLCIADECDDVMALFIWQNHFQTMSRGGAFIASATNDETLPAINHFGFHHIFTDDRCDFRIMTNKTKCDRCIKHIPIMRLSDAHKFIVCMQRLPATRAVTCTVRCALCESLLSRIASDASQN